MKKFIDQNHNSISLLLLVLVFVSMPLKNSINNLFFIVLLVYGFFYFLYNNTFNKSILKKMLPLIFFFIAAAFSLVYTENLKYGIQMLQRFLPFLVLPIFFSIVKIDSKTIYRSLKAFSLAMIFFCFFSHIKVLIKFFNANDSWNNFFNNDYSYYSLANETIGLHSTYYAYYIIFVIISILYFLLKERRKWIKLLCVLSLGYLSFFILHLSVRTAIVSLFLIYNFYILYYFKKRDSLKKGVLLLLLFYIICGTVGYNIKTTRYRFQHIFGFTYYNGIQHDDGLNKLKQWEAGIKANNAFIFGNGVGDANTSIYNSYTSLGLEQYAARKYNAHNQFIQTYVGLGIIGLLILLLIFIFYIYYFWKKSAFTGLLFLATAFLLFQTESYLERQNGILLFVLVLSMNVVLSYNKSLKQSQDRLIAQ